MGVNKIQLCTCVSLLLMVSMFGCAHHSKVACLPAFPGAEGGGACAVGGRGGKILEVTELNDFDPNRPDSNKNKYEGTFRWACEQPGPRIVVFRVGGTIELNNPINIKNSFITIAGQTAPGGGIVIDASKIQRRSKPNGELGNRGDAINIGGGINKFTGRVGKMVHDVVIRYLRIRVAKESETQSQKGIFIRNGAYNIIIDHCSLSWASDENLTLWQDEHPTHNITWQWNIIGEGLKGDCTDNCPHSSGMLIGARNNVEDLNNLSVHHNFFISNYNRNPLMSSKDAQVINNIVYNWRYMGLQFAGGIKIDIIGNIFKNGPDTQSTQEDCYDIAWRSDRIKAVNLSDCMKIPQDENYKDCPKFPDSKDCYGSEGSPSIYIAGNWSNCSVDPQLDPSADNWKMMQEFQDGWKKLQPGHLEENYRRQEQLGGSCFPITINNVLELEKLLFAHVGASRRLDENGLWVMNRDVVDKRYLSEYHNGAGKIPLSRDEMGGFPTINEAEHEDNYDSDKDGMPDAWEKAHNLDPKDPDDRNGTDLSPEGYTNVEVFLNGPPTYILKPVEKGPFPEIEIPKGGVSKPNQLIPDPVK